MCIRDRGYVAAKVAEDLLGKVLAHREATGNTPNVERGTVVLGNVEDDYHPLGRKMVSAFLRMAGWRVHDLGVDVEAAAFVDAAVAEGARVIGASAMMLSTARNVPKLRAELDQRGLSGRIQLAYDLFTGASADPDADLMEVTLGRFTLDLVWDALEP